MGKVQLSGNRNLIGVPEQGKARGDLRNNQKLFRANVTTPSRSSEIT